MCNPDTAPSGVTDGDQEQKVDRWVGCEPVHLDAPTQERPQPLLRPRLVG